MPAHQIWSGQVTQEANLKKFLFCPTSTFNIMKSHKISGGKALYFRSYPEKPHRGGGGGGTSSVFRVKQVLFFAILTRNISAQTFPPEFLSICEYIS